MGYFTLHITGGRRDAELHRRQIALCRNRAAAARTWSLRRCKSAAARWPAVQRAGMPLADTERSHDATQAGYDGERRHARRFVHQRNAVRWSATTLVLVGPLPTGSRRRRIRRNDTGVVGTGLIDQGRETGAPSNVLSYSKRNLRRLEYRQALGDAVTQGSR